MRWIPYMAAASISIVLAVSYLAFPNVETVTVTELETLRPKPTEAQVRRVLADVKWLSADVRLVAGYPFRCSMWTNTGKLGGEPENAGRVKTALIACYRISQDEFVGGITG